ncbi:ABC transporter ATP-binding protein [Rhodococcus erythropolis]|uniref:ABC transporter ATP-binding protein n=1 Tax=Rhodococcus erythropolis TaxID=1833 RepID=UPI001F226820|nr:ABC transporter ATP-binding protein [Rhodococcus erythropolis]UJC77267.1 ABC transporter ATP-binding protein [Rhodococcus erythropolis]
MNSSTTTTESHVRRFDETELVASMRAVNRSYGDVDALSDVSFEISQNKIYGLLGRNGAGKTTIMQILTGQDLLTSGDVEVFGAAPFENADVLANVCFVKESQTYPEDLKVKHVLVAAGHLLPHWDHAFAEALLDDFQLPLCRKVKKLSRGMRSALGVIIGLASRAPLTLFDEPYLGLDAVARQLFYDRLLADYAEHPRTVVLSTHLIDEVANLLEHVIVVDSGRIVVDEDADALRGRAVVVSGPIDAVDAVATSGRVLRRETLGAHSRIMLQADVTETERIRLREAGVQVEPASLQELVIATSTQRKEITA